MMNRSHITERCNNPVIGMSNSVYLVEIRGLQPANCKNMVKIAEVKTAQEEMEKEANIKKWLI